MINNFIDAWISGSRFMLKGNYVRKWWFLLQIFKLQVSQRANPPLHFCILSIVMITYMKCQRNNVLIMRNDFLSFTRVYFQQYRITSRLPLLLHSSLWQIETSRLRSQLVDHSLHSSVEI